MATISINNLARAIYESSKNKDGAELDAVSKKIINLILKKHLMSRSKEILNKLEKLVDKNEEVVRVTVSSRAKLEKGITDEIEDFIKKRYKAKNTVLEFNVNPKLLGGIKLEVEDEVIDMTLKNKVNRLKEFLIRN
jgi:F-type H+-transporting ATPase subunit delta